jgi:mono/diheme cytochrome c family protein
MKPSALLPVALTALALAVPAAIAAAASTAADIPANATTSASIDFNRDVRPLLSDNCFACHGPDTNKRKSGLRLDEKDSAFGKAESGETAIVPGHPEQSELLRRVTSTDRDEQMPPAKDHKRLKPDQVDLLTRWIKAGAPWEPHWAFRPVKMPALPGTKNTQWPRGPIDRFILARLEKEGLAPSPEADRPALIRRVSLDLIGLPPTLEEVDAFVRDASLDAFEKVVDRLLASPHFGERLALPWLDLARYGDTSGYHNDSLRDMWLWREGVIKAFNANQPFDQFTIEQLAGDLVPQATIEQQIASGFHRNVMTSDEGGIIDAEYLNLYMVDRVNTTGVTWLGMTVGCAQCHDHKYDPLKQREYYQLYSFFHNVPENGKDGVRDRNPKPFLAVPSPEQKVKLEEFDRQIAAAEAAEKQIASSLGARQKEWETQLAASDDLGELKGPWTRFPLEADAHGLTDTAANLEGTVHGETTFEPGKNGPSLRVAKKGWAEYGDQFAFERDQPFAVSAWLKLTPDGGSPFGKMTAGGDFRGWDVEFHGAKPSVHLIHQWPDQAIQVQAEKDLPLDTFLHLAFTYDGSGRAAGVTIYVNGEPVKTKAVKDKLPGSILTAAPFSIGGRGGAGAPFSGQIKDVRVFRRTLAPSEIALLGGAETLHLARLPEAQRTPAQKQALQKFYRETQAADYLDAQKKTAEMKRQKTDFERTVPNTMVMAEMDQPRDTFIKVRGAYDQNGDKVTAGVPAFLPPLTAAPANGQRYTRLDLARWLVSPEQPLTARVTVNRWWKMLFGTGIVKTVNDFGAQGEWPSHPELLDWLAADFMRDWDIKRAIKQMVLSATYRQSARITPELLARDNENRLLARGPRNRLDAEIIRDNALAIGGILNPALGGRSIKPAQPPGTWEINEMSGYKYEKSTGADLYRRGLYVYWRRSTVYPSFVTLDAPTREFCVAQRSRTSTPLQSLVLMNDPVFVEAARAFAQRILTEGHSDDGSRLELAWRLALSRPPSEPERLILQRTLDRQQETYQHDPAAAQKLSSVGDLPRPANLDPVELAAWIGVCNVILNLNETITD